MSDWKLWPRMYKKEIIGKRTRRTIYKEGIVGISGLTPIGLMKYRCFKLRHQSLNALITAGFIIHRCHSIRYSTEEEAVKECEKYVKTLYKEGYMTLEDLGIKEVVGDTTHYVYKNKIYLTLTLALMEAFNY